VLLAEAERTVREQGVDALSLRELARQAGVSHGAPRRHFADRQALLDALAEHGFHRLADIMCTVHSNVTGDYLDSFRALAHAYVDFAINDAALMELMFATKNAEPPPAVHAASERFFEVVNAIITQGHQEGRLRLHDPYRLQMLLVATLQGIATLVAAGRLKADQVDDLIRDTAMLFTQDHDLAIVAKNDARIPLQPPILDS
jgi:AcrR family transcriptional regulator